MCVPKMHHSVVHIYRSHGSFFVLPIMSCLDSRNDICEKNVPMQAKNRELLCTRLGSIAFLGFFIVMDYFIIQLIIRKATDSYGHQS